jgi:hypothetical protein
MTLAHASSVQARRCPLGGAAAPPTFGPANDRREGVVTSQSAVVTSQSAIWATSWSRGVGGHSLTGGLAHLGTSRARALAASLDASGSGTCAGLSKSAATAATASGAATAATAAYAA